MSDRVLVAAPLTAAAYTPYGQVLAGGEGPGRSGNQGRARVWDRLVELENGRPGARPNLGVFRTGPWPDDTLAVRLLERHPASTQVFVPMTARRYLVVVARGGDRPDLATLAAFVAGPGQGVSYAPGTWHHPLVALDAEADFACLVWEDGTAGDCELVAVDGVTVDFSTPRP